MADTEIGVDECSRRIRRNVGLAEAAFLGATGDAPRFDRSSVDWLDAEVRALAARGGVDETELRTLESVWGAFFGECFARTFHGRWVLINDAWFGVAVEGAAPEETDDDVVLRGVLTDTGTLREPSRAFRRMPSNADATHVPVRGGSDVIRRTGRAIVNPWGVVSSALRGDDGASIRALFAWFAGEHAKSPRGRLQAQLAKIDVWVRASAQLFLGENKKEAHFDLATIEWVESRARGYAASPSRVSTRNQMFSLLATAFGESLRREYGGEWVSADDDDLPLVYVRASDVTLNPWTKIDRALDGDPEASPVRMYHWIQQEFGLEPRVSRA